MKPYTYVCKHCGSDDVSLEGFIRWDAFGQKFDVTDLCDEGHYCRKCDGECRVVRRRLTRDELREHGMFVSLAQAND